MTITGIEFELTRKRVKNVHLRIHPPDGRVTVSAPLFDSRCLACPQFIIWQMNSTWILHEGQMESGPARPQRRCQVHFGLEKWIQSNSSAGRAHRGQA